MGMGLGREGLIAAVCGAALFVLSGCDRGPASIPARDHSADLGAAPATAGPAPTPGADRADADLRVATTREDPRTAPVPLFHGKPMWAANRRHTAEENARYQFARDGADFGARDFQDYVAKAHAFVDTPPHGVQELTRDNGDKLLYDAKANVFAVVSREGAPRTMFKPRDGAAYWAEQKERLSDDANADGARSGRYGSGRYDEGSRDHRSGQDADDQG